MPASAKSAPARPSVADPNPTRQADATSETHQVPSLETPSLSGPANTGTPHAAAASRPIAPWRPPAEAAAEAERRWHLVLLERLRDMKRYPMAARRLGQEGVVLIEARIAEDGRLEGARIKTGSGYPLLDDNALRLLETAAEAVRGQLRPDRPTRLDIPIAYRLESG
jgi:protein TonB